MSGIGTVTTEQMLSIVELIRPQQMSTVRKVRVGNANDGGYVMPEVVLGCDALLSIGIGWDVSFDLELAERGATVVQFDHTLEPGYVPGGVHHDNFELFRKGWGPRSEDPFLDLDDMVRLMNRHRQAERPALNFDVEGAEYEALASIDTESLAQFEVIACELHDWHRLGDPVFNAEVRRALEVLATHHVPVHLHANNNRPMVTCAGVTVPEVVEVSYLRRDLDNFDGPSSEPMPGPLDAPNNPYLDDLVIVLPPVDGR